MSRNFSRASAGPDTSRREQQWRSARPDSSTGLLIFGRYKEKKKEMKKK